MVQIIYATPTSEISHYTPLCWWCKYPIAYPTCACSITYIYMHVDYLVAHVEAQLTIIHECVCGCMYINRVCTKFFVRDLNVECP